MKLPTITPGLEGKIVKYRPLSEKKQKKQKQNKFYWKLENN